MTSAHVSVALSYHSDYHSGLGCARGCPGRTSLHQLCAAGQVLTYLSPSPFHPVGGRRPLLGDPNGSRASFAPPSRPSCPPPAPTRPLARRSIHILTDRHRVRPPSRVPSAGGRGRAARIRDRIRAWASGARTSPGPPAAPSMGRAAAAGLAVAAVAAALAVAAVAAGAGEGGPGDAGLARIPIGFRSVSWDCRLLQALTSQLCPRLHALQQRHAAFHYAVGLCQIPIGCGLQIPRNCLSEAQLNVGSIIAQSARCGGQIFRVALCGHAG